jgi:hypothetical protein
MRTSVLIGKIHRVLRSRIERSSFLCCSSRQCSKHAQSRWTLGCSCYRYASDYQRRGDWGMFRHEMRHGLLIEGGIHHLDQLRNLCGADCETTAGWDWNPGHVRAEAAAWRSSDAFDAKACALLVMRMTDGSFASYEGNNLATGKLCGPSENVKSQASLIEFKITSAQ